MKKEKRNKLLAVFLVMVMAILLLSGCGGKRAEKLDNAFLNIYLVTSTV